RAAAAGRESFPACARRRASSGDLARPDSRPCRAGGLRASHPGFLELLEALLDVRQEPAGVRAVDQPVIVAERQMTRRVDRDGIVTSATAAVGRLYHDRALLDAADAEDRDLRLIDQRQPVHGAEDAGIRDREGAALDLVGVELLRSRARREVLDRAAQADEILLVRIPDHGDDEPLVERDRDAEVDVL